MEMAETIAVLLSWAVHLSSYPAPAEPPSVVYAPHSFFVENACRGKECKVLGWYDNKGVVYIDERLRDEDTSFTRSLLVHEFVHYLQDLSGKYDAGSCDDQIIREREAYAIQRAYVAEAYGEAAFLRFQLLPC